LKILLIQPPLLQYSSQIAPNLGLASIAAVLEKEGISVKVLEAVAESLSFDQIIERIREINPDIVASGGQTPVSVNSIKIFRRVKHDISSRIVTLAGGPHFTFTAEESLKSCPELDIVVRGEGEYTILEVCQRFAKGEDLEGVHGITYRAASGKIIRNPDREQIQDLDSLPFPAWHLFPYKKYHWTGINVIGTSTSRGCKFKCPHCIVWKIHQGRRLKSPKRIVEELVWVKRKFGIDTFSFHDDSSFSEREHLESFLDEMEKCGEKIYWYYETREDVLLSYRDLWHRMKDNGMFKIVIGLETPNNELRAFYGRNELKHKEVEDMFYYLEHELDILVAVYLLFGSPDETKESIMETINYGKHLYPRYCSFIMGVPVTPFPGTELHKEMKAKDLITTYDWGQYGFGQPIIKMKVSPEEGNRLFRQFWMKVYSRPIACMTWIKGLFSRNKFRRAIAKNFLLMPFQIIKLSRMRNIDDK
jgi:radical SAM superfamily enzyme YgiQ (UPF0313 family)